MSVLSNQFDTWLATRPPQIQALAKRFPLGTVINNSGSLMYLIGYNEGEALIVSPVDPSQDYEGSLKAKQYICKECWEQWPNDKNS